MNEQLAWVDWIQISVYSSCVLCWLCVRVSGCVSEWVCVCMRLSLSQYTSQSHRYVIKYLLNDRRHFLPHTYSNTVVITASLHISKYVYTVQQYIEKLAYTLICIMCKSEEEKWKRERERARKMIGFSSSSVAVVCCDDDSVAR